MFDKTWGFIMNGSTIFILGLSFNYKDIIGFWRLSYINLYLLHCSFKKYVDIFTRHIASWIIKWYINIFGYIFMYWRATTGRNMSLHLFKVRIQSYNIERYWKNVVVLELRFYYMLCSRNQNLSKYFILSIYS